jgi:hypothetical protein
MALSMAPSTKDLFTETSRVLKGYEDAVLDNRDVGKRKGGIAELVVVG